MSGLLALVLISCVLILSMTFLHTVRMVQQRKVNDNMAELAELRKTVARGTFR